MSSLVDDTLSYLIARNGYNRASAMLNVWLRNGNDCCKLEQGIIDDMAAREQEFRNTVTPSLAKFTGRDPLGKKKKPKNKK